jgi:ribosomal protein S18 acetylase RimI-like enzyme
MIRMFKDEDLERVMEIGNAAWQGINEMKRQCYGDELYNILVPDENTVKGLQVKGQISVHPEWIFIYEEEGSIVGFITFELDYEKKIGEILNNAVDPGCSLKGMGQQMYKAVLDHFREKGMLYAQVSTGLDYAHAPARKAYERAGFNIHHEDIRYFQKL